ncbi:TnsA endonuclease N-terminal domain-containing protein [Paraburkholderia sp. SIMBA_050]|uniref:TnsA endonuclease N-terminal domain-containing protein n=1 Tax=Paraburkholderia TaxID=1822464 RepID=UPI0032188F59
MHETHESDTPHRQTRPAYHQTRNPVTPSGRGFRAKFFSRKNRRLVRCESLLEFDALFLFEFARGVRTFEEQPVTIEYSLNGRSRRYTPDFGVDWADGRRWFVEVKPAEKLAESQTIEKFDALEQWFSSRGHSFVVLSELQIRRPVRLPQIRGLLRGLGAEKSEVAPFRLPSITAGLTLGETIAAGTDETLIRTLLAHRLLACDLDSVINHESVIRPFEEADDDALFL